MISIIIGNITKCVTGCIVNAANKTLLGGGGVDGAIHRAAGPELVEYCKKLGGAYTGEAKITPGFCLPAPWVIHTVGPVWRGGSHDEEHLLALCYVNSLKLAIQHQITSIAFPSISTGAYGFPFERACRIAMTTINRFMGEHPECPDVTLVAYSESDFEDMKRIYNTLFPYICQ